MKQCNVRRFTDRHRRPYPTRTRFGRNSVGPRRNTANSNLVERRKRGVITLGEAAPALPMLHARMRAPELYTDDLPAAYLRRLYGSPDDTPVISRVDQLAHEYGISRRSS